MDPHSTVIGKLILMHSKNNKLILTSVLHVPAISQWKLTWHNDVWFLTINCRIYCSKCFMLSNQTLNFLYALECYFVKILNCILRGNLLKPNK